MKKLRLALYTTIATFCGTYCYAGVIEAQKISHMQYYEGHSGLLVR